MRTIAPAHFLLSSFLFFLSILFASRTFASEVVKYHFAHAH